MKKTVNKINSLFDIKSIPEDSQKILNDFDNIIQSVRPLNARQLQQLPWDIREFSHQLTDDRASRRLGYMNDNNQLTAYTRYYLWWNLVRQVRLFSNLDAKCFPEKDAVCLDIGSGPLTVVIALWLARPELRTKKLTWYCLDISQNSLKTGEDIFLAVAARTLGTANINKITETAETDEVAGGSAENENEIGETARATTENEAEALPWKIIRVQGNYGAHIKQKADFVTCANAMNEMSQTSDMPPEYYAKKLLEQAKAYANRSAKYLFVEQGVPKAARLLSLFRTRFLHDGYEIAAPCPHAADCPMNGFKAFTGSQYKWCNFAFSTVDAPKRLQKLSDAARLPKDRATLSFVSAVPKSKPIPNDENNQMQKANAEQNVGSEKNANALNGEKHSEMQSPQNFTDKEAQNPIKPIQKGDSIDKRNRGADSEKIRLRIASDPFRMPYHETGFYACSSLGLTLVTTKNRDDFTSGDLIEVETIKNQLQTDGKSGAVKINL